MTVANITINRKHLLGFAVTALPLYSYWITKTDKTRMTRKDFKSYLPRCWQCGWCFQNETKITNYFSQPSELPLSQCFRYPDHVCLGYSLLPSGLIEIKRKSFDCIFLCARMPVYRVLFRLKFSSVSGHMIKCLLTKFGGASADNICSESWRKDLASLDSSVMIPSQIFFPSGPTTQWTSA